MRKAQQANIIDITTCLSYDVLMRTTLTIDNDIAAQIESAGGGMAIL